MILSKSLLWAHPRVGGEKLTRCIYPGVGEGSPPRGRGKGILLSAVCRWSRITPAWAGKSSSPFGMAFVAQDHPRVGGEKPSTEGAELGYWGSPPRGRGKVIQHVKQNTVIGITPAWAGKRFCGIGSRDTP